MTTYMYITGCYRLTPGVQSAYISHLMQLGLLFRMGYVCKKYLRGRVGGKTILSHQSIRNAYVSIIGSYGIFVKVERI